MTEIQDMIRERGLKQYWVSQQLGMNASYFSQIMRGVRPFPLGKVRPLAQLLGISTDKALRMVERRQSIED